MFICDFCKQTTEPHVTLRLVPVETRERVYHHDHAGMPFDEPRIGSEIVHEKKMCPTCYSMTPEGVARRMNDGREYLSAVKA